MWRGLRLLMDLNVALAEQLAWLAGVAFAILLMVLLVGFRCSR